MSGWDGIGTLVGILAILLVAWELMRAFGQAEKIQFNHELVAAGLAGLAALFGVIQFIRALSNTASGLVSAGPRFGAFLIVLLALALGYAAYLAFQAAGGASALKPADNEEPPASPTA